MPRSPLYRVRVPELVRHLFGNEPRLQKRFADETLARAWVDQMRAMVSQAVAAQRHQGEAKAAAVDVRADITVSDAIYRWTEERPISPSTRRFYRQHSDPHLIPAMGALPLSAVSRARLSEHVAARLRQGASAASVGKDILVIQAVIRWGQAERGWRVDPSALMVRRPKIERQVTRRWNPEAIDAALDQMSPNDRVVAEVALHTGMRSAELRAFDCSWIRWDEGRIEVSSDSTFRTKSGRRRSLPLTAALRTILETWLDGRRVGPVFPPLRMVGNAPSKGRYMRSVARALKSAAGGSVATGLHDLRHAYLSRLAHLGAPIVDVRDLAGHSTVTTTELYFHGAPGRMDRVRQLLDQADDEGTRAGTQGEKKGDMGTRVGTRGKSEVLKKERESAPEAD